MRFVFFKKKRLKFSKIFICGNDVHIEYLAHTHMLASTKNMLQKCFSFSKKQIEALSNGTLQKHDKMHSVLFSFKNLLKFELESKKTHGRNEK